MSDTAKLIKGAIETLNRAELRAVVLEAKVVRLERELADTREALLAVSPPANEANE